MNKAPERQVTLSQGEIVALKKAITYLKFECEEAGSLIFCGSTSINSAFDKLVANSDIKGEDVFYNRKNPKAEKLMLEKLNKEFIHEGNSEIEQIEQFEHSAIFMHPFKV
ncbi:hypothetical protein [Pseudomonas entomophila]|uniref:Uncharacterized protein n=2 Tax=Pseudomonas entomophila TaxID=312306 RepID=Q1I515_PSEE4|nr:hypothetical protein [Pseudomonas entomophila]WMW07015.1 hypothetical protein RAH46_06675 [Pseudomonas entomophila]CAK17271.1 hypothetical protein PSEEN4593 [Pseudomonas entomophila L48]